MAKANPYDPEYVMKRDGCTYDIALATIKKLKERNAWNKGKKIKKANPYDPEYVMKRDGCTLEEATAIIAAFKRDKATTLPNFIAKYGKVDGVIKYNNWKEKSLSKGWEVVASNGRSQSPRCKEYYIRYGASEEQALKHALNFQYENSPLHVQYYITRGKTLDYAKKQIRKIHDKKFGVDSYRLHLENTTDLTTDEITAKIKKLRGHCSEANLGTAEFNNRIAKTRKTFEEKGIWVPLSDMSDYKLYHKEVWAYTNKNNLSSLPHFKKRGRAGTNGAYHLDHKFSISRGYIEGVSPSIIGAIQNLEFIPWEENVIKQGKCSILLEELYEN